MTTTEDRRISLPQFIDSGLLTHSSVKCWNACRRRYYFHYVLGVVRSHLTEALRIGQMWHRGLELYEAGIPIDDAIDAVRNAYFDTPCPPYLTDEEYAVEREKVLAMIRGHYDHYCNDQILTTIVTEQAFAVPIINPATSAKSLKWQNAGKVDRIGDLPDGTRAVVERKTTSESIEPDSPYWMALRNDPQISRYFVAAKAIGYDVTKIIYDVIKKPQIRPKNIIKAEMAHANAKGDYYGIKLTGPCPDRETPEMYGARLLANIRSNPTKYLDRREIARLDCDIADFEQDLWDIQTEISTAIRTGRFYRNPASCLEPYSCEYLDVCPQLWADPDHIPDGFKRTEVLHPELIS